MDCFLSPSLLPSNNVGCCFLSREFILLAMLPLSDEDDDEEVVEVVAVSAESGAPLGGEFSSLHSA